MLPAARETRWRVLIREYWVLYQCKIEQTFGSVAEWLIATVLKTVGVNDLRGFKSYHFLFFGVLPEWLKGLLC